MITGISSSMPRSLLFFDLNHLLAILTIYINGHLVAHKECYKDFCIVMTLDFSWKNHILVKEYKMLGLLRLTFSKVDCVLAKKVLRFISLL